MNGIYVALFLAGALMCYAVPHLCAGLQGQPFRTPFSRFSEIGSLPLVNFVWGAVSLAIGIGLLVRNRVTLGENPRTFWLAAGAVVVGLLLSHFGRAGKAK